MIKIGFRVDPMNEQVSCVSVVLATPDGEEYGLDRVEEADEHLQELTKLRDFVSYWTRAAEMMRIPISVDKEVEQYGIELAMEIEV